MKDGLIAFDDRELSDWLIDLIKVPPFELERYGTGQNTSARLSLQEAKFVQFFTNSQTSNTMLGPLRCQREVDRCDSLLIFPSSCAFEILMTTSRARAF
jgi:hypothetical protein